MFDALIQRYRDWRLEVRIQQQITLWGDARLPLPERQMAWEEMARLITLRSYAAIERMERRQGLA